MLKNLDLTQTVNASVFSEQFKNLRWLTHHYPNNPDTEIQNLLNSMKIIKNDNKKKMIVTDYQFISVVLSTKDNSAARIWWRHHIYPSGPNQKYFSEWKKFLLKQIMKNNIEVIYTVHPLEGEKNIFQDLLDEKCYSTENLNEILVLQILKNCEDLNFFSKS